MTLLIALIIALVGAPDQEVQRLERHFAVVEQELLARDVSSLDAEQRAARARNIEVLREYARGGVFPHNHDFNDRRIPYFRDAHGTLCAMAYLIARSGETALVDRIARTDNNAYMHDLASDPQLIAWLDRNGLSAAEAARIQPSYGPIPDHPGSETSNEDYEIYTAATALVQGGAIAWTLVADPKQSSAWPGITALATGGFSMILGLGGKVAEPEENLGSFNLVSGAVTAAAGVVYLYRKYGGTAETSSSSRWQPVLEPATGGTRLGVHYRF